MEFPLVSIVIPTHNRVRFLKRAIDSVFAQTIQNFEIIVVDDASSDGTAKLLLSLSGIDARILCLRNDSSLGGGGARNVGIEASKGTWVAFLDDDDEWVEKKLEMQLKVLNANPSAIACSGAYKQLFPSGRSIIKRPPKHVLLDPLLKGNTLGGASLCVCLREVLVGIGGFDINLRSGQDWDLWVRFCLKGEVVSCDDVLILYNAHEGPRITKSMDAQYCGLRYFYFKHRHLMSVSARKFLLANSCFIRSRQETRSIHYRAYNLKTAVCNSSWKVAVSYIRSSGPRIFLKWLSQVKNRVY